MNLGDAVTLKTAQGNAELKVDYIEEDGSGSYRAVIYLPEGEGELGMSGTMRRSDVSESFSCFLSMRCTVKVRETVIMSMCLGRGTAF